MGQSIQVYALALFSGGKVYDFTNQATWSSVDPAVATVSGGLVTGVAAGSSQITASISLLAPGAKAFGCGGCPGRQPMEAGAAADVCDFDIAGAPAPATCDGKTKNSTVFQASISPNTSTCPVYASKSNLTFVTDGVKVTPDYKDSFSTFGVEPSLTAYYWVTSAGGTITPQFTIVFNVSGFPKVYHAVTRNVPCN